MFGNHDGGMMAWHQRTSVANLPDTLTWVSGATGTSAARVTLPKQDRREGQAVAMEVGRITVNVAHTDDKAAEGNAFTWGGHEWEVISLTVLPGYASSIQFLAERRG